MPAPAPKAKPKKLSKKELLELQREQQRIAEEQER